MAQKYIAPVPQATSRGFGNGHNGIDYLTPMGTPVKASGDGVVVFEGWGKNHSWITWMGGITVLIRHDDGHTGYAHLQSTSVNVGQSVKQGQVIGLSGSTGNSTGSHLHFEFLPLNPNFQNGYSGRVDPSGYFSKQINVATPQGGDMVTNHDQLNRLYEAVLRRPRGAGEGEDVYLGKDSGFVFNDLFKSAERAKRLQSEANEKASLITQRDQAVATSKSLQAQLDKEKAKSTDLEKKVAEAAIKPGATTDSDKKLQALKDAAKTLITELELK